MPPVAETELTLDPSLTMKERHVRFLRYTKAGFRVIGILDIRERKKPGDRYKLKCRRFHVEEQEYGDDRVFKLTKPLGSYREDEEAEYLVGIGVVDGKPQSWCTCKGHTRHGHCTHSQAMLAVGLARLLPLHPGLPYYSLEYSHVRAGTLARLTRPEALPGRNPARIPVATLAPEAGSGDSEYQTAHPPA